MADSSKFADFTEKAKQNIEQIKIGLLRHDKNPQDREFLNDISKSLNSIKNSASPVGLSRIEELCHNLEILINLIKEEKKELHQEIIITIASCRDRLLKFIFELETVQMERANVKDLVSLIQNHIDDYNNIEIPEIEPALPEDDSAEEQAAVPAEEKKSSLLPQEILNKEYDVELFQIFIEQLQENISLLRSLTDSFASSPSKDNVMNQCSNLVGKLQSSANYMDYQELAEFYLQWVAELEMAGVELSMGTPVSFDFMELKIKEVVNLFAEIEDKPADPAKLKTTAKASTPLSSTSKPEDDEKSTNVEDLQQMFSSIEESDDENDDDDLEPLAALSGVNSFDEEESETPRKAQKSFRKKESRGNKVIEIDGSFLEEEKESENYDDELFQIFVQQLQENISQLQQLTNSFTSEPNKSNTTDKCSNLVGKLQASANYMGYERLAEFYLQWIAELEMIGVELSIGSDISFDFMQEKIDRIVSLFPEAGGSTAAQPHKEINQQSPSSGSATTIAPPAMKLKTTTENETKGPVFDDIDEDDEIEEPLADGVEPIAGVFNDEETTRHEKEPGNIVVKEEAGEFSEAVDEKLESFFADIEEPVEDEELENSFMAIASLSDGDDEDTIAMATEDIPSHPGGEAGLFDDEEPQAVEFSSIAGISDDEGTSAILLENDPFTERDDGEGNEFNDALNDKLESFFGDLKEPDLGEELDTSFMKIASISEEFDEDTTSLKSETLSNGELKNLFDDEDETITKSEEITGTLFEKEPVTESDKPEGGEFSDAVDEKLESLFADLDDPEGDEELETSFMEIASNTEEEAEEKPVTFTAEPPVEDDTEDQDEDIEEPLGEGIEAIAGLYDDEAIESDSSSDEISESGEFMEALDDKLESFFTDSSESTEEDEALAEKTIASEISEEEFTESEEVAAALFEDEPGLSPEESEGDEFSDEIDDKLESFFTDLEGPESEDESDTAVMEQTDSSESTEEDEVLAEETITSEISAEEFTESAEVAAALFEEEPGLSPEESEGDEIDDKLESFFTDLEGPEDTTESEEPSEDIITSEITAISTDADEMSEDFDDLMIDEESPGEKQVDDEISIYEETTGDDESVSAPPEEMLSDEELLQEIEGPIVGEEIPTDTQSLRPEIEIPEEVASVLSDDLTEEELFKKLAGAIAANEDETSDLEDLEADEEIFDESAIAESAIETAPERKELFQKLSSALRSLDDETGDLETVEETDEIEPEPEFDNQLFNRLVSALETPSERADITDTKPMDQVLEEILSSTPVEAQHTKPPADYIPKKLAASEIKQIISMDTDKVDHLMNQVGELNANRSTLKQLFAEMNDLHHHYLQTDSLNKKELKPLKDLIFRLGDTSVSLNRLSSEIREGVLKVSMVPIGLLFDRYHEFVNDLTSDTNKQVEIEIIGEDTELEKIVIDEISEPLTHIISNVVEHAIESVEERKSLGKNEVAKLKLEAYHDNSEIVIEVTDDGRGIDLKKVKAKALEQGLFTGDELYQMSESDLKRLILNPEFSTVVDKGAKPEDRGEGLHIVQTNIEKLKGSIDIRSKEGQGTIIQVRVPLNLLVIKALKVKAGKEIMALPVSCIEEILKVGNDVILEKDGSKIINFHETSLPVFKLTDVFNLEPADVHDERVYIIVVQEENQSIGLIVDDTFGLEEIIIKPLGEFLRKESGFAGATIISDGNISLVPDVAELIQIATQKQPVPEKSIA